MNAEEQVPILCDTCLGPNPYIRMQKKPNGVECRISKRPTMQFIWKSGTRSKSTCISYQVAVQKNLCMCCMTDLTYGLPVQVRDTFMQQQVEKGIMGDEALFPVLPKSLVGKDYVLNQQLALVSSGQASSLREVLAAPAKEAIQTLTKGAIAYVDQNGNNSSSFNKKLPMVCNGWLRENEGCLKAQFQCPYRPCCGAKIFPELKPETRRIVEESITTPVANSITKLNLNPDVISQVREVYFNKDNNHDNHAEESIADESNATTATTLFLSNIAQPAVSENLQNLLYSCYSMFGHIVKITCLKNSAFLQFDSNLSARRAFYAGILPELKSPQMRVAWARPPKQLPRTNATTNNKMESAAAAAAASSDLQVAQASFTSPVHSNSSNNNNEVSTTTNLGAGEGNATASGMVTVVGCETLPPPPAALLKHLANKKQKLTG